MFKQKKNGCVISVVSSWGFHCVEYNLPLCLNQYYLYGNYLLFPLPSKQKLCQYDVILCKLVVFPMKWQTKIVKLWKKAANQRRKRKVRHPFILFFLLLCRYYFASACEKTNLTLVNVMQYLFFWVFLNQLKLKESNFILM